jgi:hypothetical protein
VLSLGAQERNGSSRVRMYRSPIFNTRPSFVLPALEF